MSGIRNPAPRLTRRELDVLRQLATGASNREMARSLFVTEATSKATSFTFSPSSRWTADHGPFTWLAKRVSFENRDSRCSALLDSSPGAGCCVRPRAARTPTTTRGRTGSWRPRCHPTAATRRARHRRRFRFTLGRRRYCRGLLVAVRRRNLDVRRSGEHTGPRRRGAGHTRCTSTNTGGAVDRDPRRLASCDGRLETDGKRVNFSHVFRFTVPLRPPRSRMCAPTSSKARPIEAARVSRRWRGYVDDGDDQSGGDCQPRHDGESRPVTGGGGQNGKADDAANCLAVFIIPEAAPASSRPIRR